MRTMGKELRFHPVEFLEPGIRGFKILIRLLKFRRTFFDFRFQSYIQRFNLVISESRIQGNGHLVRDRGQ